MAGILSATAAFTSGSVAFDKGFAFRGTSGYVADNPGDTYVLAETYPTTRNDVTFGWVVGTHAINAADRNNSIDVRLAGINYTDDWVAGTATYFRVDLPSAGNYAISIAQGDASFGGSPNPRVLIQDTTTLLYTVTQAAAESAGTFLDAQSALYSSANWPASNSPQTFAFATSQLRLLIGDGSTSSTITLAYLRVVKL